MVCSRSYLQSVLRHIILILDAYHEDTQREQECDDPCLLFEVKKVSASKQNGKLWSNRLRRSIWPCHHLRPLTLEFRVRSQVNSRGSCGGQSCTGKGFPPSTSVFHCQFAHIGRRLSAWTKTLPLLCITIIGEHNSLIVEARITGRRLTASR